jgi:hypothetical protein
MLHHITQVRGVHTLIAAIRESQVIGLGGSPRLSRAIRDSFLGQQTTQDHFWFTVIQWFCNQGMLDPRQVQPILDYIRYERTLPRDVPWTIKGRTVTSLMRGMAAWHGELARVKKLKGKNYTPSGYQPGKFEFKKKKTTDIWTIQEILSSKELAAEGRVLRHCVYSYGWSIDKGRVSIWTMRLNDERVLTIELVNESGKVALVRGKANRMSTTAEKNVIQRWKTLNGLL